MKKYSPRAQQILALARKQADRLSHPTMDTTHLLMGIIDLAQGVGIDALKAQNVDLNKLNNAAEKLAKDINNDVNGLFSSSVKKALKLAENMSEFIELSFLGSADILLGLLAVGDQVSELLKHQGITVERTVFEIKQVLDESCGEEVEVTEPAKRRFAANFWTPSSIRDLNVAARNGELHTVFGRERELEELVLCLGRKIKHCPVLLFFTLILHSFLRVLPLFSSKPMLKLVLF